MIREEPFFYGKSIGETRGKAVFLHPRPGDEGPGAAGQRTADLCGHPRVYGNLRRLLTKDLLIKTERLENGVKQCEYRIDPRRIAAWLPGQETLLGEGRNVTHPGQETLPGEGRNVTHPGQKTLPGTGKKLAHPGTETEPGAVKKLAHPGTET